MTRHYLGNHDKKCPSCGSYLSKADKTGLNRIQCGKCKQWHTEYKRPAAE